MIVIQQHIVIAYGFDQILYCCEGDKFYLTNFQANDYIELKEIKKEIAFEILKNNQSK